MRVPSEAVLENRRLFVLAGDTIEERDILVGLSNWGWTEVLEGVTADELVVISIDVDGVIDGAFAEIGVDNE